MIAKVKTINLEGELIKVVADNEAVRPYSPMISFLHSKAQFSFVFEEAWQQMECYLDSEWCTKQAVNLLNGVEEIENKLKKDGSPW